MTRRWKEKFELSEGKWIYVPTSETAIRGKKLKEFINSKWQPPKYFYHLREGGHVAAIRPHLQSHFFTKLDLSNFFASITASRVTRVLRQFFSYQEARFYAKESTVFIPNHPGRVLPYGFVQSMQLASLSLAYSRLGRYFEELAKVKGIVISVYVDDILISSVSKDQLDEVNPVLQEKVANSNFHLNHAKSRYSVSKIDVFNIELQPGSMRVSDQRYREFLFQYGMGNEFVKNGIYTYIKSINPQQANRLQYLSP